MTARVDFTNQSYFRDPVAGIAQLRSVDPVVEARFPIIGRIWITTAHDLAAQVLKDSATFSMRKEDGGLAGLRWWMPASVRTLANSMLSMDEPAHTRLREIVDEAFRRRAILAMEPRIRSIADDLAASLFTEAREADLVERYARILPLSVICELLGLPPLDRPRFIAWAQTMSRLTGAISFLRMLRRLAPMKRYLEGRLRHVREHGGEGLIAELVRVEMEGGRISADEMISMVFLLLGAGSETTTHLISGSVYELLKNPALRDWLAEDWSRVGLAVEEFLRFVSPVQFTKPRFMRRDAVLGGVQLKRATGSWQCWRQPIWIPRRTSGRSSLIPSGGRIATSPSEREFTSVSVISLPASKACARCKRSLPAGLIFDWLSSHQKSVGDGGPD